MAVVHAAEVRTPRMTTQNAPSIMLWCPHFVKRPARFVLDAVWCPVRCSMATMAVVTAAVSAMWATDWAKLGRTRGEAGPIAIAPSASTNCSVKLVLARGKVERILFARCRRAPSDPRGGSGAVRNTRTEALRASHKGAVDARQAAVNVHALATQVHA